MGQPLLFLILTLLMVRPAGILSKAPAGTLPMPGFYNQFLDRSEVTNAMWREYVDYVKAHPKEFPEQGYPAVLPNLEIWTQAYPEDFERPNRYDAYPVVGLDYPQVVQYCKWRSAQISAKRRQNIVFTLPSVFEYSQMMKNQTSIADGLYATSVDIPSFVGLCDNAAEMTDLEGMAMAGFAENCGDTLFIFKADPYLSFRCKAYFK